MDDDDIKNVELWIRTRTLAKLTSNLNASLGSSDALIEEETLREYFGEAYASEPEQFQFMPGDIKLIKQLIAHVKKLVDEKGENKGLKLFEPKKCASVPSHKTAEQMASAENQSLSVEVSTSKEDEAKLKSSLFEKIMHTMKQYNVNEYVELGCVADSIVAIHINDSLIHGEVDCVMCQRMPETKDVKPKSVSYVRKQNSQYWVISNFTTHLKRSHKLTALNDAPRKPSKSLKKLKRTEPLTNGAAVTTDDIKNAAIVYIMDTTDNEMEIEKDDTTVGNFYEQVSNQITFISQAILGNNEDEYEVSVKLNVTDSIVIKVVPSPADGNCLFMSLAHQLYGYGMNTKELIGACTELRAKVAKYIQMNADSFQHEIKGRVYENIENENVVKSNPKKPIDIVSECSFFINMLLPRNRYWGGAETLKAVSQLFEVNIIVFYEEDICQRISKCFNKTIAVVYRLGSNMIRNHYDSVTDIDSNDIYTLTQT